MFINIREGDGTVRVVRHEILDPFYGGGKHDLWRLYKDATKTLDSESPIRQTLTIGEFGLLMADSTCLKYVVEDNTKGDLPVPLLLMLVARDASIVPWLSAEFFSKIQAQGVKVYYIVGVASRHGEIRGRGFENLVDVVYEDVRKEGAILAFDHSIMARPMMTTFAQRLCDRRGVTSRVIEAQVFWVGGHDVPPTLPSLCNRQLERLKLTE